jgi:hypothetical protein
MITTGCIRYSFTGSTLPAHIKSISIPLVENASAEIGLEETLRESIYNSFSAINILQVTENNPDAELKMRILAYRNIPDEYDASGNVKTYKVIIDVSVLFLDLKENEPLFEGDVRGVGIYDHVNENEKIGLESALKRINEIIINNTVSGW